MNEQTRKLARRVRALTGLNDRAAAMVAVSLLSEEDLPEEFTASAIVREAESMGYEFERPEGVEVRPDGPPAFAGEVSMDPAVVLAEVYENSPRVLSQNMPAIGKAPDELRELAPELVEQLPEDVLALLVKVDQFEGKATFWLRDEANDVDRPIGPIDLTRYTDGNELREAFETLMKRLPRVLAADMN